MPSPVRRLPLTSLFIALTLMSGWGPASALAQSPDANGICDGCDAEQLIERLRLRKAPIPVRERPGWSPPEIVLLWGSQAEAEWLASAAPDAEFIVVSTVQEAVRQAPRADVFIGPCTAPIVEVAERLRWIQHPSAGVERCVPIPELRERDVLVTNAQRLYGPVIAESVIAMTLSLYRNLPRYTRARSWDVDRAAVASLKELAGTTMFVVGLGGIGTEVAMRANALGMRVVATRRSSRSGPDFVDHVGLSHELLDLAAEADVVVNSTPLTPETTGMFDAGFFEAMKSSAYFINVGRGRSVVTEDLVQALESGTIAGAALDVTDPEPLPRGHRLWDMPNVIITPHVSSYADGSERRRLTLTRENLRRYVAGEPMLSVVDLDRGY